MEILNFERLTDSGNIVAIFDFTIPALGFTCRRWKLIRSRKNKLFVSSPSYSAQDAIGNKIWHNYIEVSNQRSEALQTAILRALEPYIGVEQPEFDEIKFG